MIRWVRNVMWSAGVLSIVGGGYIAWDQVHAKAAAVTYRTAPVMRGNLLSTIGASGSLEPEEAVDVGAQVAGQISRFGNEGGKQGGKPIDRCSYVKTGDLLAQIDPSLYKLDLESAQAQLAQSKAQLAQNKAQLEQCDANLAQSDANIVKAEADIQQMEAKKNEAEYDWNRAQEVWKKNVRYFRDSL